MYRFRSKLLSSPLKGEQQHFTSSTQLNATQQLLPGNAISRVLSSIFAQPAPRRDDIRTINQHFTLSCQPRFPQHHHPVSASWYIIFESATTADLINAHLILPTYRTLWFFLPSFSLSKRFDLPIEVLLRTGQLSSINVSLKRFQFTLSEDAAAAGNKFDRKEYNKKCAICLKLQIKN